MTATATQTVTRECLKCQGTGRLAAYAHVAAGVCFDCAGRGVFTTTVRKEAARKSAAARREAKREADRQARVLARIRSYKANGYTLEEYAAEVTVDGVASDAMRADWSAA